MPRAPPLLKKPIRCPKCIMGQDPMRLCRLFRLGDHLLQYQHFLGWMTKRFRNVARFTPGIECEVLLVGRTLLTPRSVFDLEDLLPGCWSDQGSYELVLRRISNS